MTNWMKVTCLLAGAGMAFNACTSRMRGLVMLLRVSRTGKPVDVSAFCTCVTLTHGFLDFNTAQAPATCGAAMEVPWKLA